MSGSGYHLRYSQQSGGPYFPETAPQSWSPAWPMHQQQHQHYPTPAPGYSRNPSSAYSPLSSPSSGQSSGYPQLRTHQQYHSSVSNNSARGYQQRSSRYNSSYGGENLPQSHYGGRQQQNWHRHQGHKRSNADPGETFEPKSSGPKKKKKLPQNAPSKKEWTIQEAEMALKVEKEYIEKSRNHSLLIRFPDLELNRNIVEKLHPEIESVFFQNSYAPRFCSVTLNESVDADAVITELNKQKFGNGYITAEYKDKEDDIKIDPEDIDPTILFVGNFTDEVTLDELKKIYPKHSNILIVSKMKTKPKKNAFVSFNNVTDSIEAFKETYNKLFHSKNLTVKFRKFNGPIGMPGEAKQQNPSKAAVKNAASETNGSASKENAGEPPRNAEEVAVTGEVNIAPQEAPPGPPVNERLSSSPQFSEGFDIKPEPYDEDDDEDIDVETYIESVDDIFVDHRPKVKTEVDGVAIKVEPAGDRIPLLKLEPVEEGEGTANEPRNGQNSLVTSESDYIFRVEEKAVTVKEEPKEESDSENMDCFDEETRLLGVRDFNSLYGSLRDAADTLHEAG